jgi:hypothetical protein
MAKQSDKPVTEKKLAAALKEFGKNLDKKFVEMHNYFDVKLEQRTQSILDHFDAVAENIHRDVAGANSDEISLVHNKIDQHEERITALEQKV